MSTPNHCPTCDRPLDSDERFCPGCGTRSRTNLAREPGGGSDSRWHVLLERIRAELAPRYQVLRVLGFGGMAGVYLAEETRLARCVAIKVMAPELIMDPSLVSRFQIEAQTMARLRHPNIVAIHSIDDIDGLPYFAMEYVEGRTLAELISCERRPLPIPVVLHWLHQVGSALDYAHQAGVVHRDVKPGNVLLDAGGNALVSDFGIAKVEDQPGLTKTGMLVGTPTYVSPEYCLSGEASSASDQYSFGVVAYEVLAGRPPFAGVSVPSLLQSHISDPPPLLADFRPDCPPEVRSAVERMLAKRPEDRFPNIGAALVAMGASLLPRTHPLYLELGTLGAAAESVSLEAIERTIYAGDSIALQARVTGPNGMELRERPVSWTSEDPERASVDEEGILHTHTPGEIRVTARCDGAQASVNVRVSPASAGRIELQPIPQPLLAGTGLPLRVQPGEADTSAPIRWSTSDPRIAVVTADGRVHALNPGTTVIFASAGEKSASTVVRVHSGAATDPQAAATPVPSNPEAAPPPAPPASGSPSAPPVVVTPGRAPESTARRRSRVPLAVAAVVVIAVAGVVAVRGTQDEPGGASSGQMATGQTPLAPELAVDAGAAAEPTPGTEAPEPEPAAPAPRTGSGTRPEPPAAPAPGEIRVSGSLPSGSTISVTGTDRQARRLSGRSLSVPAGSYTVEVAAAGYQTTQGVVQVAPGSVVSWTPVMVENPSASGRDAPSTAPRAASDLEEAAPAALNDRDAAAAAIRETVGSFARSLESRDVVQIQRYYPNAADGWLTQWRPFLTNRSDVRNLRASVATIEPPELSGEAGRVRFVLLLAWDDIRNARQQQRLNLTASVRRDGGSWLIQTLEGGR